MRWVSVACRSPSPKAAPATLKYRRLTAAKPCATAYEVSMWSTASFEAP